MKNRRLLSTAALAVALVSSLDGATAGEGAGAPYVRHDQGAQRAQRNYTQFCSGCHLPDGSGAPTKGIPSMQGMLARFLGVPGGRQYIVQVPGVMNSGLKDGEVAELMNWLVGQMSPENAATPPPGYSPSEIAMLRSTRPVDVPAARRALIQRMALPESGQRAP
ncbi:c-type cytochrome [Roseateles koreensis]|uniref:Cytochrome c domain-containing protein n=1 Tax=Roseateles koreensis TaxID=2987526 RepID=A0ABT5KTX9_9BURK|nr:hypothetical protein [Roseateles koreensis]MDC8786386.1 hypothetical protein [Roseateles koreensis]